MKKQITNYPAIGVCTLLNMFLPAMWYMVFSEPWMEANGLTEQTIQNGHSSYPYLIALVSSIVGVFALSYLTIHLKTNSLIKGAMIGLLIGISFNLLPTFTQNSFSFKTNSLSMIDGGINVLNWVVTGAILGVWKKYKEEE